MTGFRALLFALFAGIGLVESAFSAQRLLWLGTLGGAESEALAVSANGNTVAGWSRTADGRIHAFHWTAGQGMQDLGTLGGRESLGMGLSADGQVVVGRADRADGTFRAFRWSVGGIMQDLGTLGGSVSVAYGVSADGRVVVGWSEESPLSAAAFRWTEGAGMSSLGTLGGPTAGATGVSADGAVAVGGSLDATDDRRAFRWSVGQGMHSLGTLGGSLSVANGVSGNGQVAVGYATTSDEVTHAFRWTAHGGMQDLDPQGTGWSEALGVSTDGGTVVGVSDWHACWWKEAGNLQDLNVIYAGLLAPGDELVRANAVSATGSIVVGYGFHAATWQYEAFVLDTRPLVSLSGHLELEDFIGDITQVPVRVVLRQGSTNLRTETLYLDAHGDYTLSEVAPGTYAIAFKPSHWLNTVVTGVQVADVDLHGVDATVPNGDVDGDNEVTLFDFGQLVSAFGSMPGDSGWNPNADLDGDEEVTLFDFGILVRNFGMIGDD